jgi:hypothetical protein
MLLAGTVLHAAGQSCNKILWSKHRHLKWRHFRGRPDKRSPASALTASAIEQKYTQAGDQVTFHFASSFSPCGSWVKTKDANLLRHERTHFDLTEYYKRLMAKEILDQRFTERNLRDRTNSINEKINRLRVEENELYDKETDHSINQAKQQAWRKLRRYDEPEYTIQLSSR